MQVFGLRPSHLVGAMGAAALGAILVAWSPWSAPARASAAPKSSTVAMNCAPDQQALVRQVVVNGELNVSVECGSRVAVNGTMYRTDFEQTPQPVAVRPSVYRAVVPVPPPRVRAARAARPVAARTVERRRDWKKDVLIVGGSAGAGAGIGGLVGGKKGALIGAALGGGGAALFRAVK